MHASATASETGNAAVIALVARRAIRLQHLQSFRLETVRLRQRLDQDLTMARLARRRTEAVRERRDERGLRDRPVCHVEARIAAQRGRGSLGATWCGVGYGRGRAGSGDLDLEPFGIRGREAFLQAQHLDRHDLLLRVEIQHDSGLDLLGFLDLRIIEAEIERVGLLVVVEPHCSLLNPRSK
jgi:hypothetical protein